MDIEAVLAFVDTCLQPKQLCDLQELVLRGVWAGHSYDEIAESSGYTSEYIKHIGAQLWKLLSKALGERVTKGNVHAVLRRHWQNGVGSTSDSPPSQGIHPYCRISTELATLEQWILQDCCRVMTLLGMSGTGQARLSLPFEQLMSSEVKSLSWHSFYSTPKVQQILTELIEFLSEFADALNRVLAVALSPDGKLLATGGKNEIRLWQIADSQQLQALQGHTQSVFALTFSPDGRILASGSEDCTVRLWDTQQGQCLQALQGHTQSVRALTFSPDGRILASGGEEGTVRLWNAQQGQCLQILQGHTQSMRALAFSPDSRMLASSSEDGTVRLWDIQQSLCLQVLQNPNCQVCSLVFTPDGNTWASGCKEEKIQLWHLVGSDVEAASRV